ncbi:MAG: T9SS type A sorting domain-containing protein [Candidatus Latescibacterota bacterium]|nr:MAG: T9SS type A sorting domain-containing protein [Candidatus Latescibacterota bacterium]
MLTLIPAKHRHHRAVIPAVVNGGAVVTNLKFIAIVLIGMVSLVVSISEAQWTENGVPVRATPDDEYPAVIVTNDAGGALILFHDTYEYAHIAGVCNVDAQGVLQWSTSFICERWFSSHRMIPDGAGGVFWATGAIISGGSQYTCQGRIKADGSEDAFGAGCWDFGWLLNGPDLCSDGVGGVILTWHEWRDTSTTEFDVRAQRIDEGGGNYWELCGVEVCAAAGYQWWPRIATDDANGGIVVWGGGDGLYAQRVDKDGNVSWTASGVPICTATGSQVSYEIIPDGAGGAVIVWQDGRRGDHDIFAQRIDTDGNVLWVIDGIPVCEEDNDQEHPLILPDGVGGVFIAWRDRRNGDYGIYAQRIDSNGTAMWSSGGEVVCGEPGDQQDHAIVTDGVGGIILAWSDGRGPDYDVYAQRLDGDGNIQWPDSGVAVCAAPESQDLVVMTSDGTYGAIVAWQDHRNDTDTDIYATRISGSGVPVGIDHPQRGMPPKSLTLHQNLPNPFNPSTLISYYVPERSHVTLDVYDAAGRWVVRLVERNQHVGAHTVAWNGHNASGIAVSSGVYFARLAAGPQTSVIKMVLLR